jgi:type VI secretion system secreted protein VgrG
LSGHESINALFTYQLILQTPDQFIHQGHNFDLDSFVGRELTCRIELDGHGTFVPGMPGTAGAGRQGAGTREISGLITAARYVNEDPRHGVYEITLRPWLYLACLRSDCRIFQDQTPAQVINDVLTDFGFPVERNLIQNYPKRDYTVQYNETAFEFVTRLMQEWGINYHFEHAAGTHRLILSDHNGAFQSTQDGLASSAYRNIDYHPPGHKIDKEYIHALSISSHLRSGGYSTRDYDYTRPRAPLQSNASEPRKTGQAQHEHYLWRADKTGIGGSDYSQPNAGMDKQANQTEPQGQMLAQLRMQQLRQSGLRANGEGHLRGIVPGCSFALQGHPHQNANIEYIVLSTDFVIENPNEETQRTGYTAASLSDAQQLSGQWRVHVSFELQPSTEVLRPVPTQNKPRIHGPQPAIVCGPDPDTAESNLYTDQYGRIKVQFPWDRLGQQNQNSSCWVRVASPWAGNQLGATHVPRVGQEVVVLFYEGDPDLPVVVGSVHNALNLPSWSLPEQQAISGFRSRELLPSAGNSAAGRSNHILLDDTPDKIQAQLKSDHQHSQLSLGHISRIDDNRGRKDYRGEGFELRTDGHGAVRADRGLLLSTHGRSAASGHALDMPETTQRLGQAQEQHTRMGELAQHHLAHDGAALQTISDGLTAQNNDISGNGHTRTEGTHPELQAAHIVLASPAGIASTTQGYTHQHSEKSHAITTGQHISLSAVGNSLFSAGQDASSFAKRSQSVIAGTGVVKIEAQANDLEALAQKVVRIIGRMGIQLRSDTEISLGVGANAIRINQSGIHFISPTPIKANTATIDLGEAQSWAQFVQDSPTSQFNDPYVLTNALGEPIPNMRVRVTRSDGSMQELQSDAQGQLPELKNELPEQLRVELLDAQ